MAGDNVPAQEQFSNSLLFTIEHAFIYGAKDGAKMVLTVGQFCIDNNYHVIIV